MRNTRSSLDLRLFCPARSPQAHAKRIARCLRNAALAMDYGKRRLAPGIGIQALEWDRRRSHPVSNDNSVTCWLDGVKLGDGDQIQRLWDRYFERLVRLAGSRLPGTAAAPSTRRTLRSSAFQSFCDGDRSGAVPPPGGPRRPLAAAGHDHDAQGDRHSAAPGPAEARRRQGRGRVGR